MTNRKPYPILSALKREGDTFTLGALKLWMYGYSDVPPQVSVNDNDPLVKPVEWEANRYELSAEDLIEAYESDEENKDDPKYVKQYSAAAHEETRRPKVRRTKRPMPPIEAVDAEEEVVRHLEAIRVRDWLGEGAVILDMAVGPFTYREVAKRGGCVGSDRTMENAGRDEVKDTAQTFWREVS